MYRSTVPHSWRQTWAAIAFLTLTAVLAYWLITGPLMSLLPAPYDWVTPNA
jgi:hypothetical protein